MLLVLNYFLFTTALFSQNNELKENELRNKIDSLLELMSLEEKIGQMTLFSSDYDVTGPVMKKDYVEGLKTGRVGAIF